MRKGLVVVLALITVVAAGGMIYAVTRSDSDATDKGTTSDMNGMDMSGQSNRPTRTAESSDATPAATSDVTIQNYAYAPSNITVKKGTKVTWTNQDSVRHDVDSDDGKFTSSQLLAKGESYSYTFDTAGTFTYHCSPHPYMKATVIVTE